MADIIKVCILEHDTASYDLLEYSVFVRSNPTQHQQECRSNGHRLVRYTEDKTANKYRLRVTTALSQHCVLTNNAFGSDEHNDNSSAKYKPSFSPCAKTPQQQLQAVQFHHCRTVVKDDVSYVFILLSLIHI